MSLTATVWAWDLAYVPPPRPKKGREEASTKPSPTAAAVLLALADAADDEGKNAFPAVETICRRTRLSERVVREALDLLAEEGCIRPAATTRVRDAVISRADRRPVAYDLVMDRVRGDLTERDLDRLERNPLLAAHVAQLRLAVA